MTLTRNPVERSKMIGFAAGKLLNTGFTGTGSLLVLKARNKLAKLNAHNTTDNGFIRILVFAPHPDT